MQNIRQTKQQKTQCVFYAIRKPSKIRNPSKVFYKILQRAPLSCAINILYQGYKERGRTSHGHGNEKTKIDVEKENKIEEMFKADS